MTSGRKLTEEQVDAILRLAGQTTPDGEYRLTYRQIGDQLEIHRRTISRVIRRSAVRYGERLAWKSDETV